MDNTIESLNVPHWNKKLKPEWIKKRLTVHVKNPGGDKRNQFHSTKSQLVFKTDIENQVNSWGISKAQISKAYYGGKLISL